jgi:hypothetical protein
MQRSMPSLSALPLKASWRDSLTFIRVFDYRYIKLVKKHGLDISQPGLQPDRGLTWQMTKRRGDGEVHK